MRRTQTLSSWNSWRAMGRKVHALIPSRLGSKCKVSFAARKLPKCCLRRISHSATMPQNLGFAESLMAIDPLSPPPPAASPAAPPAPVTAGDLAAAIAAFSEGQGKRFWWAFAAVIGFLGWISLRLESIPAIDRRVTSLEGLEKRLNDSVAFFGLKSETQANAVKDMFKEFLNEKAQMQKDIAADRREKEEQKQHQDIQYKAISLLNQLDNDRCCQENCPDLLGLIKSSGLIPKATSLHPIHRNRLYEHYFRQLVRSGEFEAIQKDDLVQFQKWLGEEQILSCSRAYETLARAYVAKRDLAVARDHMQHFALINGKSNSENAAIGMAGLVFIELIDKSTPTVGDRLEVAWTTLKAAQQNRVREGRSLADMDHIYLYLTNEFNMQLYARALTTDPKVIPISFTKFLERMDEKTFGVEYKERKEKDYTVLVSAVVEIPNKNKGSRKEPSLVVPKTPQPLEPKKMPTTDRPISCCGNELVISRKEDLDQK
ncbi:MAG: hypothetical protein K2X38_02055 [Gemmataceae bacterium]|nr:hypothetical protein [Gemmataceae bacterium]